MSRWQPDAHGRLAQSAMELFAERGFDQVTAAEIAERAGVTERTFFRYFTDKREVLFDRTNALEQLVVVSIDSADAAAGPLDAVGSAWIAAASVLEGNRDYSRARARIIDSNPSLRERELLKMAALAAASASALRRRNVPEAAARLAGDAGVAVFRAGFESWIGDRASGDLAACIGEALAQLRGLAANA